MRRLRLLAWLAVCVAVLPAGVPVRAQEGEPTPPGEPGFTDGVWFALFVDSGPLEIGSAGVDRAVAGSGLITVTDGVLSGDYTADGSVEVMTEGGGASGTMATRGNWTGTATDPGFLHGGTTISGTMTVEGSTHPFSYSFPAGGGVVRVPIISATCSTVITDWPGLVNSAFAGAGVSSRIYGSFVATRLLDAMSGDEPPSYAEQALALHMDGLVFYADATTSGGIDYAELDDLLTRAEDFYERMTRAAACDIGDAGAWLGLMAGMVEGLLRFALDNPGLFDNMDLLRLVTAAVRMGLIGSSAVGGQGINDLEGLLVADAIRRAAEAAAEGDCDGAIAILVVATMIGDPAITSDVAAIVTRAC